MGLMPVAPDRRGEGESPERILQRTRRVVERSKQLAALNAIASSVSQSLDFQQTLESAVHQVPRLMGFEAGLVLLIDKGSGKLTLSARHGLSGDVADLAEMLTPNDHFIGPVVQTGEPLMGEVPREESDRFSAYLRRGGFWFFVAIPLRAKGRTLGIMVLVSHGPRHVDPESSQFLLSVGDVIGVAIENATLYRDVAGLLEETQRQANRLKESERQSRAIAELGRRALAGVNLSSLMQDSVSLAAKTLGVAFCALWENLLDRQSLLLRAGTGWPSELVGQMTMPLSMDTQTGYTLQVNRSVIVGDLRQDPRFNQSLLCRRYGMVSGMSVVIPGQNGPFGVLGAHTSQRRIFTNDEVHFLQGIANVLAEAIERKRTEEALAAETERLTVTLRNIADGVITTDTQGKVVLMNKVAETLTGWTQHEVVKQPLDHVFRVVNEKARKPCESPMNPILEIGRGLDLPEPVILVAKDGTERMITYESSPMHDWNGSVIGAVVVFRDVAEKQRMEEERLRSQKLESIGLLAGGIAHDFNNLLMAVLGNISLAKIDAGGDEKILDRLTAAERACLQSKNLTQQLLTFSKGGAPIKKTTTITGFIQETADFILRGSNVRCELSTTDSLLPVDVDEGQIGQVIQNLVLNAQQAMPDGGTIRVQIENADIGDDRAFPLPAGKYVRIAIRDQGMGIPKKNLTKVFDPYFSTKEKGTGLGLATAYSIVRKHEGIITVESEVGVGTTFTIYLPASVKRPVSVNKVEAEPQNGQGRVLIMDDEKMIRDVTGHILKRLGYEVEFACDGAQAIELYQKAKERNQPIDVVIMDLTIPGGMGGKEAIKRLRDLDPHVRAIVSSGYSNDPVMADFQSYGFSGCVAKPYKIQDLSETVSQVLRVE